LWSDKIKTLDIWNNETFVISFFHVVTIQINDTTNSSTAGIKTVFKFSGIPFFFGQNHIFFNILNLLKMMPFKLLFGLGNRKKSGERGVHSTSKCQSWSVVSLHVRHCAMVYWFWWSGQRFGLFLQTASLRFQRIYGVDILPIGMTLKHKRWRRQELRIFHKEEHSELAMIRLWNHRVYIRLGFDGQTRNMDIWKGGRLALLWVLGWEVLKIGSGWNWHRITVFSWEGAEAFSYDTVVLVHFKFLWNSWYTLMITTWMRIYGRYNCML